MQIEQKEKLPGRIIAEFTGGITLNGDPVQLLLTDNPLAFTAVIKEKVVTVKVTEVGNELCKEFLKFMSIPRGNSGIEKIK